MIDASASAFPCVGERADNSERIKIKCHESECAGKFDLRFVFELNCEEDKVRRRMRAGWCSQMKRYNGEKCGKLLETHVPFYLSNTHYIFCRTVYIFFQLNFSRF